MTKFAFIQSHTLWVDLLGVMHLSSVLKQSGHETDIFFDNSRGSLASYLEKAAPDIVAFSVFASNNQWTLKSADFIKNKLHYNAPILLGGPHATFFPETIHQSAVDIVCRGEGELAIAELADRIKKGLSYDNVANLWVKNNSNIFKNDPRPLVKNLDELPNPDRDIYSKYRYFRWTPVRFFIASRGCPFKCAYCFNHQYHELYPDAGHITRFRSHERFIEEILYVKSKYNLPIVYIEDDTFNLNKNWLYPFLEKFKQQVNLPFQCNLRLDLVDEDQASRLKKAGCDLIAFGLETGNEELRKKILKKNISNREILNSCKLLKSYGIRIKANNMLGLPGETLKDAIETLQLNIDIHTDSSWVGLFQPFPGLELTEYAIEHGHYYPADNDKIEKSIEVSFIRGKDTKRLTNLQKFFYFMTKYPKSMRFFIFITKFRNNILFKLFHKLWYVHYVYNYVGLSPYWFFRYALKHYNYNT